MMSDDINEIPDQSEILAWAVDTFGSIALHPRERALRFLEEALELCQACGLDREVIPLMVDRVYANPPGSLDREVAQAQMTLSALSESQGVESMIEMADEFARISKIPRNIWRDRHAAKGAELATPLEGP